MCSHTPPPRRSAWQVARRLGYALLGALNGTEINPNFDAGVLQDERQACVMMRALTYNQDTLQESRDGSFIDISVCNPGEIWNCKVFYCFRC